MHNIVAALFINRFEFGPPPVNSWINKTGTLPKKKTVYVHRHR